MADTYWAEREGARWDVYSKQRGWMAQADTEDDARLIVAGLEALQAPPAAVPEALLEIGRRLAEDRKRNDHYTADPIYTVQREVRIYGLDDDYAERFAWIEDSAPCASGLSARLERRFNRDWPIPDRYKRIGYCTQWQFVDAYLSYEAAKERVEYESRKHHGTYRTYVESGCRNHEWKALQAWLLAARKGMGDEA